MEFSGNNSMLWRLLFIAIFFAFPFYGQSQKLGKKGRLVGLVRDERADPLAGATVTFEDGKTVLSNVNGQFEMDLDSGTHTVVVTYSGKNQETIKTSILPGQVTRVDLVLLSASLELVTVTAKRTPKSSTVSGLYNLQRNNASVSDGISIQQIVRTPDNNVAQALKRVNGVTILENKFVVIRGMGERYNSVLMNGSQLPSTEANKRNFSFDLVPSNLIENIIVNKTASPDLPADFAGGVVQITTKEVPDKNTFFLSAGSIWNTHSTGKESWGRARYNDMYIAKTAQQHYWYKNGWNPVGYYLKQPAEVARMNAAIPNTWGLYKNEAAPWQDYQAGLGLRKRFNSRTSVGVMAAASYRNEQFTEDYTRQTYFRDSISGKEYSFSTNMSGVLALALNHRKSKIVLNNLLISKAQYDTYMHTGYNNDNTPIQNYIHNIDDTRLLQHRLEGEHALGTATRLKWFADRSSLERDQPDNRFISYQKIGATDFNSAVPFQMDLGERVRPSKGGITSSELEEQRTGAGIELTQNLKFLKNDQKLKAGFNYLDREVDYSFVFLKPFHAAANWDYKYFGNTEDELIVPGYFSAGIVELIPLSGTGSAQVSDDYIGRSKLSAGYLMGDLKLATKLRLSGGLRVEGYDWSVKYITARDSVGKVTSDTGFVRNEFELFPSANMIYQLRSNTNLRFSFGKTISRPDFREVAPFSYYNFVLPAIISGFPGLKNCYIYSYDLRYELYPSPEEVFSLSVFYKKFIDPIESLPVPQEVEGAMRMTVINQRSSENIGVEMDLRKSLAFFGKGRFWKNLFFSSNVSIMRSDLVISTNAIYEQLRQIDPTTTYDPSQSDVRSRPLQGLSPYMINGGILYQGEKAGFNIAYNRFGRRVVLSGLQAHFDVYENPRDVLDLQVYGRLFKKKLEIRLNISDVLSQDFVQYDNSTQKRVGPAAEANTDSRGENYSKGVDYLYYKAQRGTNIGLSFNYKL